ncbi:hypothetical protein J0S82_000510 [Galemys pyrenaicus]|uniref:Glycoprotein Xg n=1 Tax=Galemys pyrenaicus TaxID=202257 RepID=A0A8J6A8J5_GALPY|nr:hypothetical protein J0S82_000510 [Galemys pyrenaicus]
MSTGVLPLLLLLLGTLDGQCFSDLGCSPATRCSPVSGTPQPQDALLCQLLPSHEMLPCVSSEGAGGGGRASRHWPVGGARAGLRDARPAQSFQPGRGSARSEVNSVGAARGPSMERRGLAGLWLLTLALLVHGQGDFDLADALDDPDLYPKLPQPQPGFPDHHGGGGGNIYPKPKPPPARPQPGISDGGGGYYNDADDGRYPPRPRPPSGGCPHFEPAGGGRYRPDSHGSGYGGNGQSTYGHQGNTVAKVVSPIVSMVVVTLVGAAISYYNRRRNCCQRGEEEGLARLWDRDAPRPLRPQCLDTPTKPSVAHVSPALSSPPVPTKGRALGSQLPGSPPLCRAGHGHVQRAQAGGHPEPGPLGQPLLAWLPQSRAVTGPPQD